ncbi:hypothetical protein HK102_005086 [Quaeritorhiza haematococci]|nr:hypothetical protein HK102_005086 [Quaeritorhiza haematococci]
MVSFGFDQGFDLSSFSPGASTRLPEPPRALAVDHRQSPVRVGCPRPSRGRAFRAAESPVPIGCPRPSRSAAAVRLSGAGRIGCLFSQPVAWYKKEIRSNRKVALSKSCENETSTSNLEINPHLDPQPSSSSSASSETSSTLEFKFEPQTNPLAQGVFGIALVEESKGGATDEADRQDLINLSLPNLYIIGEKPKSFAESFDTDLESQSPVFDWAECSLPISPPDPLTRFEQTRSIEKDELPCYSPTHPNFWIPRTPLPTAARAESSSRQTIRTRVVSPLRSAPTTTTKYNSSIPVSLPGLFTPPSSIGGYSFREPKRHFPTDITASAATRSQHSDIYSNSDSRRVTTALPATEALSPCEKHGNSENAKQERVAKRVCQPEEVGIDMNAGTSWTSAVVSQTAAALTGRFGLGALYAGSGSRKSDVLQDSATNHADKPVDASASVLMPTSPSRNPVTSVAKINTSGTTIVSGYGKNSNSAVVDANVAASTSNNNADDGAGSSPLATFPQALAWSLKNVILPANTSRPRASSSSAVQQTSSSSTTSGTSSTSPSSSTDKAAKPRPLSQVSASSSQTQQAPPLTSPRIPNKPTPDWAFRPPVSIEVRRFCQGADPPQRPTGAVITRPRSMGGIPLPPDPAVIASGSSSPMNSPERGRGGASGVSGLVGVGPVGKGPTVEYAVGSALRPDIIDAYFYDYYDVNGLLELAPKDVKNPPRLPCCSLCDPEKWIFDGSQYDSYLTRIYAEKDGCIPSSVVNRMPKFIVPWRYKNKRTGDVSWKIYHLHRDKIKGPENETIVVNPYKDHKLRAAIEYVANNQHKYKWGAELVEFLLKVVRETLGEYGMPGGPTSAEADAKIYQKMLRQGHNFVLLCDVEIGVCRHKAMLFKILCDVVHLNCAVVTGYSTAGRHQWNIITIPHKGDFLIDPTSKHFTWAKPGSMRTRGYKVMLDDSMGHAGFTQKAKGFI